MTYDPTPKQKQAIREWLQEAIVPLIEQVLVQKLGQAISFVKQEVISPPRQWVGLTDEDWDEIFGNVLTIGEAIKVTEAKLKEKNT